MELKAYQARTINDLKEFLVFYESHNEVSELFIQFFLTLRKVSLM